MLNASRVIAIAAGLMGMVGGPRISAPALSAPSIYSAKTRRAMRSKYMPHEGMKQAAKAMMPL
jgi:hypothetical protein